MTTIQPISHYQYQCGKFSLRKSRLAFYLIATLLFVVGMLFSPPEAGAPIIPSAIASEVQPPVQLPKAGVVAYIQTVNKDLSVDDARMIAMHAIRSASEHRLNLAMFLALIRIESGFKPEATSPNGALGLTQVIPRWHADRIAEARKVLDAYSLYEPKLNLYVGASALRAMIAASRDLPDALLRYNGSLSDQTKSYANVVMAEAYRVQLNFLNAPSRKL